MATIGVMATEVLDRLGRGRSTNTFLVAQVKRQLRREFKTLCGKRDWHWKRAATTITTSATDDGIDLPTVTLGGRTVSRIHRILGMQNTMTGRWLQHQANLLELMGQGTTRALFGRREPERWCITGTDVSGVKRLLLSPLPGAAYTFNVYFTRSAASMDLLEDDDEPPFDEEYEGYLVEKAVAALAAADATMGEQVAQMAMIEARDIYRNMCLTERKGAPVAQSVPDLGAGWI